MSGRRIAWLAGLLIVQLIVVAALLFARGGFREPEAGALLVFDGASVDAIRIDEGAEQTLELRRGDAGWSVGDGLPADDDKVAKLLERLGGLQPSWPVATTASARQRFEVTDENRQRQVRLLSGGRTVAELLLGTSPGFRRLHARIPGADEIYEVDLSHFELSTSTDEWLDRTVLAARGDVASVAREGHWRIARSDDGWMLDDGAADAAKAEEMASRFTNLRVLGVAEPAADDAPDTQPTAVFVVADGEGEHRLSLFAQAEAADFVVVSDRQPGRFRLAAFAAEQMLVEKARLLPGSEQPASESTDDPEAEAHADGSATTGQATAAPSGPVDEHVH